MLDELSHKTVKDEGQKDVENVVEVSRSSCTPGEFPGVCAVYVLRLGTCFVFRTETAKVTASSVGLVSVTSVCHLHGVSSHAQLLLMLSEKGPQIH
jgi:hypothetical protein